MFIKLMRIFKFILINTKMCLKCFFSKQNGNFNGISTIVFTHNLGGGTETFVNNSFRDEKTLIIKLVSYRNNSFFRIEQNKQKPIYLTQSKLEKILLYIAPKKIIINSLVSYSNIPSVLALLINKYSNCHIEYMIHDYHCICPYYTFIYKNEYCLDKCCICDYSESSVKEWRCSWASFLSKVDSIRCFSNSSKNILCSFYPEVEKKIVVIPHDLTYCNSIQKLNFLGSNVAIIGNCTSIPKGKNIVKQLIKELKKHEDISFYLIGNKLSWSNKSKKNISYLGKYNISDLHNILEINKIGIVIFPSICPETFSYSISEYIRLGVYIIALDIGAPGEKLHNYEKAILVDNLQPETLINEITKIQEILRK